MHKRWLIVPSLAAAALLLAACGNNGNSTDPGSSASSPPANTNTNTQANTAAATVTIKTLKTSKGTVLTDSAGQTLYWYAKDTAHKSNCNGSCATYWPPVIGKPVAAAGASLPKGFGTIKRANGEIQATYDGHPLYTYSGDTAAGQINGNDMDASGGYWWAMTPNGKDLGASSSSSTGSGNSGSSGNSGGW
jgi:predicted lipoprotein with Yx(FWY)xxD motif